MIDREKLTAAIDECLKTDVFKCEDCPYLGKQADVLSCVGVLMKDARELLKTDQTYLLDKDEKIKKLHLLLNTQLSLADQTKKEFEDEIARLNRELDAMNRLSEMQMEALQEAEHDHA